MTSAAAPAPPCACGVRKVGHASESGDLLRDRIYAPHTLFEYEAFCRLIEREPDWDGPYACSWLCGLLDAGHRRATTRSGTRLGKAAGFALNAAIRMRRATRCAAVDRAPIATN